MVGYRSRRMTRDLERPAEGPRSSACWRGLPLLLLALGCAPESCASGRGDRSRNDELVKHYKLFARLARSFPLDSQERIVAEIRRLPGFKEHSEFCDHMPDSWCALHEVPHPQVGSIYYLLSVEPQGNGLHRVCLTLNGENASASEAVYAIEEELGLEARRDENRGEPVWYLPDRFIRSGLSGTSTCVQPLQEREHKPGEPVPG